ncbi:uncharacterized protein LOC124886720 [Capsicum annuum]|uniref:uncharacterized protein LOC124886720 n=1 Tax=Capsicum annuum TaxID=4072 RepID=UPI001FB0F0A4|nr:uncharacterized protein LOC124886720 [Capsicum annuum]
MVSSWILNSLSKDMVDSVEYVSDSLELWNELEDRYDQTNGAKLYQLQKEINDLSQGTMDIPTYYTKKKKLWEELNTLCTKSECSCVCSCGAKETMHKAEQDRRLIQFLMGLNEVYTIIRGSLLMMNPLPSMGQAFALLVQEEKQREFKPIPHTLAESSPLNVGTSGNYLGGGRPGNGKSFRTNYNINYDNGTRSRPFCNYCKKLGHTRDKCFKIHGYPNKFMPIPGQHNQKNQIYNTNSRVNKGKGVAANVHGEMYENCTSEKIEAGDLNHNTLSKEQYNQLVDLLRQFQVGTTRDVPTVKINTKIYAPSLSNYHLNNLSFVLFALWQGSQGCPALQKQQFHPNCLIRYT